MVKSRSWSNRQYAGTRQNRQWQYLWWWGTDRVLSWFRSHVLFINYASGFNSYFKSQQEAIADQTAKILTSSISPSHSIPEHHVNVNNLSPVIITPDQASAPDNLSPPTAPPQVEKTRRQARHAPPASEQPRTLRCRAGTSGATDSGPSETFAIIPTNTASVNTAQLVAPKRGPGRPMGNKAVPKK